VIVLYGLGSLFALSAFVVVLLNSVWIALLLLAVLGTLITTFCLALYVRVSRMEAAGEEHRTDQVEPFAPSASGS
jgi:hypothetical protein